MKSFGAWQTSRLPLRQQRRFRYRTGTGIEYEAFLHQVVPALNLRSKTIVLDCANGAASAIAPELFATLGGTVHLTHSHPDGRNINEHCGALHPEIVAARNHCA